MLKNHTSEQKDPGYTRLLILPLWIIVVYATGNLILDAAPVCLWLVCSFFLMVLLDPLAQWFKARKWPTAVTAAVLILIVTGLVVASAYFFGELFAGMFSELQHSKRFLLKGIQSLKDTWDTWLAHIPGSQGSEATGDNSNAKVVSSSPLSGEMGGTILRGLGSFAATATFAILVPILSFFLLAERDALGGILKKAYNDSSKAKSTWNAVVRATRAYFFGNLILGVITFPLFVLLFWLFAVPSKFNVAALATIFNLVPFAGSVLSGLLPAVSLYGQTHAFGQPAILYGCCVVIHFVIADFVTPKLLGSQVNINATTSTIALVVWGELWGAMGLLLAIPVTAVIKILFEHADHFWLQWIASLMSEDTAPALKSPVRKPRQEDV